MKKEDLRIGNIVNRQGLQICVSGADIKWFEDGSFIGIEAIPLTEEWLVKFGFYKQINEPPETPFYFTRQYKPWLTAIRFPGLYMVSDLDFRVLGSGLKVNHVNQLQNLYYALTGTELTYKEN